ncbi:hypothetical protein D3C85_1378320 [compost metagenome]
MAQRTVQVVQFDATHDLCHAFGKLHAALLLQGKGFAAGVRRAQGRESIERIEADELAIVVVRLVDGIELEPGEERRAAMDAEIQQRAMQGQDALVDLDTRQHVAE